MTLRAKIFIRSATLNALTILTIVGVHLAYVRSFSDRQFVEEYSRNIVIQALRAERLVLWDDQASATALLHSMLDIDSHLAYAFIEREGRPFAHTFSKGVPRALLRPSSAPKPSAQQFEDVRGERYCDLAARIGGTDATLHIGYALRAMRAEAAPLLARIGLIGLAAIAATLLLSWLIAQRTTREAEGATRELRRSEENLSITLNSIGDAVIATDGEAKVTRMNPVAEQLTGWAAAEAVGRPLSEVFRIVNQETRQDIESPVTRVMRERKASGLASGAALLRRDGTARTISDSSAPILDGAGALVGVVLVFHDVTEEQRLEERSRRLDKLEAIGQLAGGLAHDFNNLLMGVFGNIELAQDDLPLGHPARASLRAAHQALENARHLTGRLLTFAKGGAPVLGTVDLRNCLGEWVTFHLAGCPVTASIDISPDLWPIRADKGQIAEVISNLTVNAKEAMPQGGAIHLSCRNAPGSREGRGAEQADDMVKLVFRDEGAGIQPNVIGKIFDPYFTTKTTGSGLGLATVHGIVSRHKGLISVASTPGQGTTFTILLPADARGRAGQHERASPASDEPPRFAGRVLLMDDDPLVRKTSSRMIQRVGYAVDTAADGREAVDRYAAALKAGKPYDLVILDLTVPGGMGGKEAVGELLKLDPSAKVTVSSGYSADTLLSEYASSGFIGCLSKPYSQQELNDFLARHLRA
jgi:PAS domain S-box-containing protein